jgi:two-component system nitrate/nitrite response regulator NarL
MKKLLRIIIADDHLLFTEGLSALLEKKDIHRVVAVYHDGRSLLDTIERDAGDILLLDLKIGQPDGLAILREIRKRGLSIKIIMLSTYSDPHTMLECRSGGANGYLLKNTNHEELTTAMNKVMNGEPAFLHLENNNATLEEKFRNYHNTFRLTRREWDILLLIKKQFTNQQISEQLHLSIYTVETHRKNLMQKLGLKTPLQLHQFIQKHEI